MVWGVSVHLIGVPDGSWPFLPGGFLVAFLGVTPCEGLFNSSYKGLASLAKFGI